MNYLLLLISILTISSCGFEVESLDQVDISNSGTLTDLNLSLDELSSFIDTEDRKYSWSFKISGSQGISNCASLYRKKSEPIEITNPSNCSGLIVSGNMSSPIVDHADVIEETVIEYCVNVKNDASSVRRKCESVTINNGVEINVPVTKIGVDPALGKSEELSGPNILNFVVGDSFGAGPGAALTSDGKLITFGSNAYTLDDRLDSGVVSAEIDEGSGAAIKTDGSVVFWGDSTSWSGIPFSSVEASLTSGVTKIKRATTLANGRAYGALKSDGSVITWGRASFGGNSRIETPSTSVSAQLSSNVIDIFSTQQSFAALKSDGSVVFWGSDWGDGTFPTAMTNIGTDAIEVVSNRYAYAVLKNDGSVVTAGVDNYGGDSSGVSAQLSSGVVGLFGFSAAFAAIKSDNSVVVWGHPSFGGSPSVAILSALNDSTRFISNVRGAVVALNSDGSVRAWGSSSDGGQIPAPIQSELNSGVTDVKCNDFACLALKSSGQVYSWGNSFTGGDSSSVQSELNTGVSAIYAAKNGAFAALLIDGRVVSWGNNRAGGDYFQVRDELNNIVDVKVSSNSFHAVKADGTLVGWGMGLTHDSSGNPLEFRLPSNSFKKRVGNSSYTAYLNHKNGVIFENRVDVGDISDQLKKLRKNVKDIYFNGVSFAALKEDGSVVSWLDSNFTPLIQNQLNSDVKSIYYNLRSYAALKKDGSIVTWGDSNDGGDSSGVSSLLSSGVVEVFPGSYTYAALKDDGRVVTWGNNSRGGNFSSSTSLLDSSVVKIIEDSDVFMALKSDDSAVVWGPGGSPIVANQPDLSNNVSKIYEGSSATFAALKTTGEALAWGQSNYGGDTSSVNSEISSGVAEIFYNRTSYSALKDDGSVVTWGQSSTGGDSSSVTAQLVNITNIQPVNEGYIAFNDTGGIVYWGGFYNSNANIKGFDVVSANLNSNVIKTVSTLSHHSALKSDGSIVTWGRSNDGVIESGILSGAVDIS